MRINVKFLYNKMVNKALHIFNTKSNNHKDDTLSIFTL